MISSPVTASDLADLAALGTATVYEASGLDCALDPAIHAAWRGARLCGPAFTVACPAGDNLAVHRALESASPGEVLVVAAGGALFGYWGEVLTVAARARGVAGLVIDGGVRDAEALERLAFPVFARGVALARTAKREPGELGRTVVAGGVRVERGDVLLGDADGVIALPRASVATVLQAARARDVRERSYLERIERGELTLDLLGLRET